MSTSKIEVDPVLAAATKAKSDAIKARAKADHSTAVVHVSTQALAAAQAAAAEHHLEAEKAEAEAVRHADLARKSLEKSLGMSAHEEIHLSNTVNKESETVKDKPKSKAE